MKIRQSAGAFPALDLMVSEVRPNATVDIPVRDAVRHSGAAFQESENRRKEQEREQADALM